MAVNNTPRNGYQSLWTDVLQCTTLTGASFLR